MPKRKFKPEILYAVNLNHEEFVGESKVPTFFDVIEVDHRFVVRYYGACEVYNNATLEGAKAYIEKKAGYLHKIK